MKFHLFKHTLDKSVVGATDEPSGAKLPVLPGNGRWEPVTEFEGSGKPRVAFSEEQVRAGDTTSRVVNFGSAAFQRELSNDC